MGIGKLGCKAISNTVIKCMGIKSNQYIVYGCFDGRGLIHTEVYSAKCALVRVMPTCVSNYARIILIWN